MGPGLRAAVAVLAAAALFGTSGTAAALLAPEAPAASVVAWRLFVGAAGRLAVAVWRRRIPVLLTLWRGPLVWVMGTGVAGYRVLFFAGTLRTGVAMTALIALGCAPVIAGLLGWAAGEGAPGRIWVVATGVAGVGLLLVVASGLTPADPVGMVAALGASGCFALYTVGGVRLARTGFTGGDALTAAFSVGALLLVPFLPGFRWWESAQTALLTAWLGLATITLAYLLFGRGLRRLQPGHIATLTLLEPAVATILGVAVLGESFGMAGVAGCVLLLGAVGLLGASEGREVEPAGDPGLGRGPHGMGEAHGPDC